MSVTPEATKEGHKARRCATGAPQGQAVHGPVHRVLTNRPLGNALSLRISRVYHERIALYSHRGGTLPHFKRREVSTYIFTIYSSMLAFHAQNSLSGLPLLAQSGPRFTAVRRVRDSEPPSDS